MTTATRLTPTVSWDGLKLTTMGLMAIENGWIDIAPKKIVNMLDSNPAVTLFTFLQFLFIYLLYFI